MLLWCDGPLPRCGRRVGQAHPPWDSTWTEEGRRHACGGRQRRQGGSPGHGAWRRQLAPFRPHIEHQRWLFVPLAGRRRRGGSQAASQCMARCPAGKDRPAFDRAGASRYPPAVQAGISRRRRSCRRCERYQPEQPSASPSCGEQSSAQANGGFRVRLWLMLARFCLPAVCARRAATAHRSMLGCRRRVVLPHKRGWSRAERQNGWVQSIYVTWPFTPCPCFACCRAEAAQLPSSRPQS